MESRNISAQAGTSLFPKIFRPFGSDPTVRHNPQTETKYAYNGIVHAAL